MAAILAREVAVMFLFIAVGMLCRFKGILNDESAKAISNIVLLVVTPALVFGNLQADLVPALLPGMALALAASALYHYCGAKIIGLFVRDPGDGTTAWRVTKLAMVLPNAGFMGFPLLLAAVGERGLLYGVMFVGIFNVANWMWAVPTLTGKKGLSPLQLLTNPVVAGFLIGIGLFLLQVRLPYIPQTVIAQLGAMNTPLSMLVIGAFLATVNPRQAVCDPAVYWTAAVRNLALPALMLLFLWVTRVSVLVPDGKSFALSILIMTACPSAASCILMPSRYGCDSAHGSKLVAASTLLSIGTLPLMVMLGDLLL